MMKVTKSRIQVFRISKLLNYTEISDYKIRVIILIVF